MNNKLTVKLLLALLSTGLVSQSVQAYRPERYEDEYEFYQDTEDNYDYDDGYYDDGGSSTARGALGGAASGALLGGIFGGGRGAAIGAGTGAGIGLISGAAADNRRRRRTQRRYDAQERYDERTDQRAEQRELRQAQHEKRARTQPVDELDEYY